MQPGRQPVSNTVRRSASAFVMTVALAAPPAVAQQPDTVVAAPASTAAGSTRDGMAAPAPAAAPQVAVSAFIGATAAEFLTAGLSLSMLGERSGWIGRLARAEEFVIFGPYPARSVWDLSIQRAIVRRSGMVRATVAAGPALVGGMNRGHYLRSDGGWFGSSYYEEDPFRTLGLAGGLDLTAVVLPFLGIGGELAANANPERPYVSAAFRVSVGALR